MTRKGTKAYILTSECTVIGAWTNLKKLIDTLSLNNKVAVLHRIYRHITKHTEGVEIPHYEFTDDNGKTYQIKIEILQ